jgi:toxin ParE1/3/4
MERPSVFPLSDRDGIFTHIEADNPVAAITVDERIVAAVRRLQDFPEIGRPGRIGGTRELVVSGTPCVAAYTVTDDSPRTACPSWGAAMAGCSSGRLTPQASNLVVHLGNTWEIALMDARTLI